MKLMMNLKLKSRWLATWLSVLTLVSSPVAMGVEAEKISKQQTQAALKQMGLDKEITIGEFYNNTKDLYPERIRAQIEPVLMKYKNTKMPKFDVVTVKGTNGNDISNIRATTENGQLYTLQLFGEPEKYAKFQNTNLSEIDIINFDDMFVRINAGDQALRKQTDVVRKVNNMKTEFPNVTKDSWTAMTPNERAGYMINLRLLWSDAKKVITEVELQQNKKKSKKTSSILNSILPDVEAAETTEVKSNNDCLVAGYVTSYRGVTCDHKQVRAEYKNFEIFNKAAEYCTQKNQFACNPLVFGTPGGKPVCITPGKSKAFQEATHYSGPCETINGTGDNHLSTNVNFLKKDIYKGRYAPENLLGIDLEKNSKDYQGPDFKQTEAFLDGVLKFSGKNNLYTSDGKTINSAAIEEILAIKERFQKDIDQATASCKASSNDRTTQEKNFWKACDQLQRRFLFVADFFQSQCKDSSKIDASTLKCVCPNSAAVNPGASCKDAAAPIVSPPDQAKPGETPVVEKPPSSDSETCPAGQVPGKPTVGDKDSDGAGAVQATCIPIKEAKKEPSFWDKLWKGTKKYAPYLIIPVVAYAAYKLFQPKQPKRKSAGDSCPNGFKPPCGQTCTAPQSLQTDGSCGCTACPPGQSITVAATCMCGTGGTGGSSGGVLIACPDTVTYVTDLSQCPVNQYTCWDGTKVPNALNCPEKPATVVPKTGTQK